MSGSVLCEESLGRCQYVEGPFFYCNDLSVTPITGFKRLHYLFNSGRGTSLAHNGSEGVLAPLDVSMSGYQCRTLCKAPAKKVLTG